MIGGRFELDLSPIEGLKARGIRKATRIGLSRATSPVKGSVVAHAEAIQRRGFLAKSIRIRFRTYPADRWVSVIGPASKFTRSLGRWKRGPRKGQPKRAIPAKYAHLVEGGTKRSRAKPFLGPAYREKADSFPAAAAAEIRSELMKELAASRPRRL